jgi:uncharacterized membrane protein
VSATVTVASPTAEPTEYRYGVIWVVLSVLLVIGTAASAFFVWGVLGLIAGPAYILSGVVAVVALFVAVYVLLLIAGILYRIDRLRGTAHRRIELFE